MADRENRVPRRSSRARAKSGGSRSWSPGGGTGTVQRHSTGDHGVVLEYTAGGAEVKEQMSGSAQDSTWTFARQFHVGPSTRDTWLVLGSGPNVAAGLSAAPRSVRRRFPSSQSSSSVSWAVRVPAHAQPIDFRSRVARPSRMRCVPAGAISTERAARAAGPRKSRQRSPDHRRVMRMSWTTSGCRSRIRGTAACRPGDIQFLQDGTGVVVTLDGDVWLVRGLDDSSGVARWKRFASGLHEPLTLAIRDDQIYVFDRNGIWRVARHQRRWRSGRARVVLECLRADCGPARIPEHDPARSRRRIHHCERWAGGGHVRQTQRQRAANFRRRPPRHGAGLRIPSAEHRRQHPHRPRHRERSTGQLHPEHAASHRPRRAVLRLSERQEAARSLSGADRRAADVDSACGERFGDVADLVVRRAHGIR